jgi:hypothetical protein
MKHVLVLQWSGSTKADFEQLVQMEDALESRLSDAGFVDGHDFGSGEMNIFIETEQSIQAFAVAKEILGKQPGWGEVRAAYREAHGETYTVLWPPGLRAFDVT